MNQIVCEYCGTEFAEGIEYCPLCGSQISEPSVEREGGSRTSGHRVGRRATSKSEKIPTWISVLVCIVLGLTVLVGSVYGLYCIGIFDSKTEKEEPSLDLPINEEEEDPSITTPDQGDTGDDANGNTNDDTNSLDASAVTSVTLNKDVITFSQIEESTRLVVEVLPVDTTQSITFTSSDATIATVDEVGAVRATGSGTAIITVKSGDVTALCTVECKFENETTQGPNLAELSVIDFTFKDKNEVAKISVSNAPENAAITWTSKDPSVATVTNGTVTAVGKGTTNIVVTVNDKTLECIVRCNLVGVVDANNGNAEGGSYSLSHEDVSLSTGETFALSVKGSPASQNWSVSDSSVCTIDGSGTVSALGVGTATISITVSGNTMQCIIRVN